MATTFDRTQPLAGLPPAHVLEKDGYTPTIKDKLVKEEALAMIKTTFENSLKQNVNLVRVTAPMFVTKTSGFNDNLNGVERPATFAPRDFSSTKLEVPFSLAKWKRWALHYYDVPAGKGIVTDFRGLRCDDDVDYTHSLYVDQFDWEKHINPEDRNAEYLKDTVKGIYKALYDTEQAVAKAYGIEANLPEEIFIANTDEMIKEYPHATPKERENILCEKYGAVFLMGIGGLKPDGTLRHDGRAPDYDDWVTQRPDGGHGLNGDILVWNPLLKQSFEISSMGIRVNPEVMMKQLELCECLERKEYMWHKMLLDGTLPQTIGGGIGQSRLCQYMLRCAHIGEVQHGWYNPAEVERLRESNIHLLGMGSIDTDPAAVGAQ
uniref:Aminoacyl-transfer RNA synthetases class-II family profile domain-containing protein n=1 Tax=Helicotheca tamesis TaxID=374047 RepID=A0A7S2HGW8_9STRA|mmetsp:Transcript_17893/g.24639  ORF Transcript_17893/g.24639 Transcript_17893/m.24639 type:complete len:377 (+) Transcript_17893:103-1233(+)|eukprot:CAMPEP_0185729286 /NCGR_PEP_ID=MMETSP1171-20130828/5073_1 /TAXON_ID=374046 /ORGANISM="Helicotheca tamensis, Strain CCMP826" /LENGTH=376 /DNA_ID=CAMNT_0028398085 /DNA_START=67 /DNA_END=1197 /DNA_ORIENTATION=-